MKTIYARSKEGTIVIYEGVPDDFKLPASKEAVPEGLAVAELAKARQDAARELAQLQADDAAAQAERAAQVKQAVDKYPELAGLLR